MRVLLTTYPERTHFLMMVPLAWALRTAGHDVRVAVQPKLVPEVTRAGLTAVPVGSDRDMWEVLNRVGDWLGGKDAGWPAPYDAAELPDDKVTWRHLRDGYGTVALRWHKSSNVPLMADLVSFAQSWQPDLVIWEPTTYAGAIAARACGAAHARLLIGADVFGITRAHFHRLAATVPEPERSDPIGDWLGSYAAKYGVTFGEDLITGHFTINSLPPSLAVLAGVDTYHCRLVQYGGPAVVPQWLTVPPSGPRVALTLGLTVADRAGSYPLDLHDVLDSLADLPVEVVATVDAHQCRKPLPPNARAVGYVPLGDLLPTCSLLIHHGGAGTLASAASYGVPQLCLPWDVDQPLLGARLQRTGAGLCTHASQATGETVRESVRRLLDEPQFRTAAAQLQAEVMAQATPHHFVKTLVELTGVYRADRRG